MEYLETLRSKKGVVACLIYGRRRVGKTELISRFCQDKRSIQFQFSITDRVSQLNYIGGAMSVFAGRPIASDSFYSLFVSLAELCAEEPTVVVFDEFPYLLEGSGTEVATEVQRFIDMMLKGTDTMVIICGSQTSVMREHFGNPQRPLFGRFPYRIRLEPLSLTETALMHPSMSAIDAIRMHLTFGGIPYYHILADSREYRESVTSSFLRKMAPLGVDMEGILALEIPAGDKHRRILAAIAGGAVSLKDIADRTGMERSGCSDRISELVETGFLEAVHPMYGAPKRPIYRISDALTAFYYEVLEKHKAQIDWLRPDVSYERLEQIIHTFLGRRFEDACVAYLRASYPCTELGKWWGPVGKDDNGTTIGEIDIAAKAEASGVKFDLMCECKMRRKKTGPEELDLLISYASNTHATNIRYILFSTGGFTDDLREMSELRKDVILVGIDELMGLTPPEPL